MKEIGRTIFLMAKEWRYFQMEIVLREILLLGTNRVRVLIFGRKAYFIAILEIIKKTKYLGQEP
jgi:hypothetical protein